MADKLIIKSRSLPLLSPRAHNICRGAVVLCAKPLIYRPLSTTARSTRGIIPDMQRIKNTLAENFGGPITKLGSNQFTLNDCPDLTDKVAVVTGGTQGIGYAVTHTLLAHNLSKIYLLSVSPTVASGARESLTRDLGEDKASRITWLPCDLADWRRVKEVAEIIKSSTPRLDILVNNSGRGIMSAQLTDYGVDRHMAVNHMGHVILTSHLLPLMKKTAAEGNVVRISNQSSNLHEAAPSDTTFDSLEDINRDVGPNGQYGRSKLAGILYARYFDRNVTKKGHPNVLMNATHPGFVSTKQSVRDIHEPYPVTGFAMSHLIDPFKKNQFEGAVPTVFAVTRAKASGDWICAPAIPEPGSKLAQNDELGDNLMKLTRDVVSSKTRPDSVGRGCPFDDGILD